jgi:chromodomain-helicase-DNA-binding protein 4
MVMRLKTSFVRDPSFEARCTLRWVSDTDHDIDTLIEKTETEEPQPEVPKEGGFSFSFAKIWAADKDALEEVTDDLPRGPGLDSWAQTLQRIETEKLKEKQQEVSGRGVRRKAAATFHQVNNRFQFSGVG